MEEQFTEDRKVWYRLYETQFTDNTVRVFVDEIRVIKETPCGVWLYIYTGYNKKKFVLRNANKRYACPTLEEAKTSFIARKQRQIQINKSSIDRAEKAIKAVENGLNTMAPLALSVFE